MRNEAGKEVALVRLLDGPFPATTITVELDGETFDWPLPDELAVKNVVGDVMAIAKLGPDANREALTIYRKVSESQLPADAAEIKHLARGAQYKVI